MFIFLFILLFNSFSCVPIDSLEMINLRGEKYSGIIFWQKRNECNLYLIFFCYFLLYSLFCVMWFVVLVWFWIILISSLIYRLKWLLLIYQVEFWKKIEVFIINTLLFEYIERKKVLKAFEIIFFLLVNVLSSSHFTSKWNCYQY